MPTIGESSRPWWWVRRKSGSLGLALLSPMPYPVGHVLVRSQRRPCGWHHPGKLLAPTCPLRAPPGVPLSPLPTSLPLCPWTHPSCTNPVTCFVLSLSMPLSATSCPSVSPAPLPSLLRGPLASPVFPPSQPHISMISAPFAKLDDRCT